MTDRRSFYTPGPLELEWSFYARDSSADPKEILFDAGEQTATRTSSFHLDLKDGRTRLN